MLMHHLALPLPPMDINSNDERNTLSAGATMPVPYHLDESDSDSIVSSEDATSYTELMNAVPMTGSGAKEEVKLGLRNAIKTRRVAQGLEGLPIIEEKRPKIDTLSFEEKEKRRIRRERNKVAAFKCRQRRKEHMQKLQDESDELDNENSALESELAALRAQRDQLDSMLRKHKCVATSKETHVEQVTDAKSPHACSAEVKATTPTSSAADSVKV